MVMETWYGLTKRIMKIKDVTKEYEGDGVTIIWKPAKCMHAEKCWRNLPDVFRYGKKPWIDPNGAPAEKIKAQIDQCPSGALSYAKEADEAGQDVSVKIQVLPKGPLLVDGAMEIDHNGEKQQLSGKNALCRCGASKNKPFCDGSHHHVDFE